MQSIKWLFKRSKLNINSRIIQNCHVIVNDLSLKCTIKLIKSFFLIIDENIVNLSHNLSEKMPTSDNQNNISKIVDTDFLMVNF